MGVDGKMGEGFLLKVLIKDVALWSEVFQVKVKVDIYILHVVYHAM